MMDTDSYDGVSSSSGSSSSSSSSHDTPNICNTKGASSLPTNTQLFHRRVQQKHQHSLPLSQIQRNLSFLPNKPNPKDGDDGKDIMTDNNGLKNPVALFSQHNSTALSHRFRSLSKYSYFQPQALDCFTCPHSVSSSHNSNMNSSSTSIGAMASTQSGILLIPIATKPYEPLLILRHCIPHTFIHPIHTHNSSANRISCLKFQSPSSSSSSSTSPRFLASASTHSPSILIWDISGQCMNPLLGRLDTPMDSTTSTKDILEYPCITSIAWKYTGEGIYASGQDFISMYDLRCWTSSSSSSGSTNTSGGNHPTRNRPNQQWGKMSSSRTTYISVVTPKQSSSDDEHWIGTLDSLGIVRLFDDRICRKDLRLDGGGGAVHSFVAHSKRGIGLEYFVSTKMKNKNTFMTWGLEEDNRDSCVKIWQPQQEEDSTAARVGDKGGSIDSVSGGYECISKITQKSLSCARVCPSSDIDAIITIHSLSEEDTTWSASVWTIQGKAEDGSPLHDDNPNTFGSKLVTTFGGWKEDMIPQVLQQDEESLKHDSLIAAELTLGIRPHRNHEDDLDIPSQRETLLCCLTNKGYLSTHAIPELSSTSYNVESSIVQRPFTFNVSSKLDKAVQQSSTVSTSQKGDLNNVDYIFQQDDNDTPTTVNDLFDSARVNLKKDLHWIEEDDLRGEHTSGSSLGESMNASFYHVDGISVHFDYGHDVDLSSPNPHLDKESEMNAVSYPSLTTPLIDPYKAMRVPSPRLCGAVFSLEKLAVFTNGSVMKTWSWFVSDQMNQNESPLTRVGQLDECHEIKTSEYLQNESEIIDVQKFIELNDCKKLPSMESPHTFWDFCRMKDAVRNLQLECNDKDVVAGADDASITNASESDQGNDSITSSAEKSDDSSVDSTAFASSHGVDENNTIYASYFGSGTAHVMIPLADLKRPRMQQRPSSKPIGKNVPSQQSENHIGLNFSSPSVFVSTKNIALCHQSYKLAEMWQLGSWEVESRDSEEMGRFSNSAVGFTSSPTDHKENFPSHPHMESDKNTSMSRNESMIGNLKTVISQKGHPMTSIPSDQRFMQKGRQVDIDASKFYQDSTKEEMNEIPYRAELKPSGYFHCHLQQVHHICIHNSKVSKLLGYSEKADIWGLLALIVDNVLNGLYDDFDGWNGLGGGSIGLGLITKILKHFEEQGDVQMLATIVCVFCGGRDHHSKTKDSTTMQFRNPLFPGDDAKFDNYILLYGSILYRWGLLGLRTALHKHLATTDLLAYQTDKGVAQHHQTTFQEIQFIPICHRCSKPADVETNICNGCKRFAFECAICMNPVRGLFVVCKDCGHGGHVKHIMPWFEEFKVCPTGCGCSCIYESSA